MLLWPVQRCETRAGSKQETLAVPTKTDREPSATRRVEKRISQLRRRSEQVTSTRAVCRALQTEGWKSNERTAIESRIQALPAGRIASSRDLTKAPNKLLKPPRKEVRQLEELSLVKDLISRIPRAIGKSGAGQSCLPRSLLNGHVWLDGWGKRARDQ